MKSLPVEVDTLELSQAGVVDRADEGRAFVGAFPDGRHAVDLVVVNGDVAAVEGVWSATHLGPLSTPAGEIPATGLPVDMPFAMTLRADGDRVGAVYVYFDQFGFLGQLGLLPQPAAA